MILSVNKDDEKLELSYIDFGALKWYKHFEKLTDGFLKCLPYTWPLVLI